MRLRVFLLGRFQAEVDGVTLTGFSAAKVRGLLAYLVMGAEREHGREALAALLWPDEPQEVAQANLRQALANLRQVIGDRTARHPLLSVGRESVGFSSHTEVWVDAAEFACLTEQCRKHEHRRVEACEECLPRLRAACDLYRGDFLSRLFVSESPDFEDWMLFRREELRESYLRVLCSLAENHLLTGEYEGARTLAARQLELVPWREEAHRQMMRAHYAVGDRSAALGQYETCRKVLAAEFGAEPAAETRELFEKVRSGRESRTPGPRLRNWPSPMTSFVGRRRELAQLARLLQNPAVRLVTVTGLGGMGKSRLLIEAGRRLAYSFRAGACFVQLSGTVAGAGVAPAIAAALDIPAANLADPVLNLARAMKGSEILLVLDNCERSRGHAGTVAELLSGCPQLTILAAASEELGLPSEWLLALDGLEVTPGRESEDPGSDAVALFVERMQRAGQSPPVNPADLAAVEEICRRLGGLPLAIELAAAWTPVLSCEEILAELRRGQRFLDAQQRDPARTISAILQRAWELLPSGTQRMYEELAVFHSGFRRSEALAVVDCEIEGHQDGSHPLDAALRLLVSRSLLRLLPSGRYRQHALLQDYAGSRLAVQRDRKMAAEDRHAAAYLGLLAAYGPELKGPKQQAVLADLNLEMQNIETAWRYALHRNRFDLAGAAAGPLSHLLDLQSRSIDAVRLFEEAAAAIEATSPLEERLLLAEVLAEAGMHYYRLHDLSVAKTLLERSLALLPPDEQRVRSLALHGLGNVVFWQGDVEGALSRYGEGQEAARCERDDWRVGCLTYLLGDCASVRGDHASAMARYEEALALFRSLGDPLMICTAVGNLGDGYRRQGLLAEAKAMYSEGLALAEKIGHRRLQANDRNGLGEVAYEEGELDVAAEHFAVSQEISMQIGSHSLANLNLIGLAHVACAQNNPRKARMDLREAVRSISEHAGWAIFPVAVAGVAHVLASGDRQDRLRALMLLEQVLCHPITWEDYRHRAMRLFVELQRGLDEQEVSEALRQGLSVRGVVGELLALELPQDIPALEGHGCLDS